MDLLVSASSQPLHLPDYSGLLSVPFKKPVLKLDVSALSDSTSGANNNLAASVFGQAFQYVITIYFCYNIIFNNSALPHT